MARRIGRKRQADPVKRRHRLFLNPHKDRAFATCPVCDSKTGIRKFVLVISIKPGQLLLMNMPCRYCQECDLIIARKRELESAVTDRLRESVPESTGTDYSVLGTLDREDWVAGSSGALGLREIKERLYAFKDVWNFDLSLSD